MPEHLIGLLLGTEDDWPRAFEALVARLPPVRHGGKTHTFRTERICNEPFDLRARPRYALVIDRLGWWYEIARERATFPAHEHERMVARHRGLIGAWVSDQTRA